jgi:hypothetical protein
MRRTPGQESGLAAASQDAKRCGQSHAFDSSVPGEHRGEQHDCERRDTGEQHGGERHYREVVAGP